MKKIILVMLLVMLSVTTVYAGLPMIGKKVDSIYPIFVDNVRLPKDAIVIEGVSYIPIRVFAERDGYDIGFKNKQIFLNKKGKKASDKLVQLLDIKSNIFKVDASYEETYITKDGEGYLNTKVFGNYYEWDQETDKITISLPDREPLMFYRESYFENPNVLLYSGFFIKLSALGLKPAIEGNTLWLENI